MVTLFTKTLSKLILRTWNGCGMRHGIVGGVELLRVEGGRGKWCDDAWRLRKKGGRCEWMESVSRGGRMWWWSKTKGWMVCSTLFLAVFWRIINQNGNLFVKINLSCCVVHLCFSIPMNILFRLLFVASSAKNLILPSHLQTPVSTFNLDKQHFYLSFLLKKNIFTLSICLLFRFFL